MTKPTLAFVDHAPRRRTRSTIFLREILIKDFLITDIWDDQFSLSNPETITKLNNFDYVLFFQEIPQINELRQVKTKIIWCPMYDSVLWWPVTRWILLSSVPMKVISFSRAIDKIVSRYKFDFISLQVFLNPDQYKHISRNANIDVFFWQRTNLNFSIIKKYLNPEQIHKVFLIIDPDKNYPAYLPTAEEIKQYKIGFIQTNIDHEEYQRTYTKNLHNSTVFIAPRLHEGIGWSFIEAMTRGLAVIAIDNPTMNEYISSGINGYLVDLNKTNQLDLKNIIVVGKNARQYCVEGYKEWEKNSRKITLYIKSNYIISNPNHLEENPLFKLINLILSQRAHQRYLKSLSCLE